MLKTMIFALLPFLIFFSNSSNSTLSDLGKPSKQSNSGTLEKMVVSNGTVSLNLDSKGLRSAKSSAKEVIPTDFRFDVNRESFFTVLIFNGELRGPLPSSMNIVSQSPSDLPRKMNAASSNLVLESLPWGDQYEYVIRDQSTGFVFFNIEGHEYSYDAAIRSLSINNGRLHISKEYAEELGNPASSGKLVGEISATVSLQPIEVTHVVDGEMESNVLPPMENPDAGSVPGPDVVVGDLTGLAQFGSASGTQVGLAVGTDSCNFGTVDLNWFALPSNDHPVIPQNLYRMSGGATNDERFEQIGASSVKHGFTALTENICNLGCNGVGGTRLGSGCSDPYSASLNAGPSLGSRAWINPFTGAYPRGDSATPPNNHAGHSDTGAAHRIRTEIANLNTSLNAGAKYYAESQYITPHEYTWCQANPTQCNMYNNVSFRQYNVSGTASPFSFSPAASTVRQKSALTAWTGATLVEIKPSATTDGIGSIGYKVTNPSPGVWHYEYAVYNQNIDRAIQSFSLPLSSGVTLSNLGFSAPPQQPGTANDGTVGSTGFSNTPWAPTQTANSITWASETFAQNPNANAIRWGTLYNFRFDSNRPPQLATATVGFFKTGAPITVQVQVPSAPAVPVSISGRVTTSAGRGVSNARVTVTEPGGNIRYGTTGPFGYYRFENVMTGATYTVAVLSKKYTFTSRTMQVDAGLTGVDFVSVP